jgi:6-pyruvoyltetrahydropterin/6-carboxytetrahydropterin synthase
MGISGRIVAEEGHPEMGMIVDYGHMKTMLMEIAHDPLDHGFMVWEGDTLMMPMVLSQPGFKWIVVPFQPTAEEISRWLFRQLDERVRDTYEEDVWLTHVSLWETPTSVATTTRETDNSKPTT